MTKNPLIEKSEVALHQKDSPELVHQGYSRDLL
jgi:hypothetical protein